MRIKSFKARTAAEALEQVKAQMGPHALIIQTRPLRDSGLLGLLSKTGVEVVAAVDDPPPAPPPRESSPAAQGLRQRLASQGIAPALVDELIDDVTQVSQGRPPEEPGRLSAALAAVLGEKLPTTGPLERWRGPRRTIAFVGPTGVGKTTTIAKLAAGLALRHHRRVALITIDAHRVGAIEQLQSYAELIGVPVRAAYTPDEFARAVGRAARAEFLLVDTPGCSYRDQAALVELEQYFRRVPELEVNVLISCCWKTDDAMAAVAAFRPLRPGRDDGPTPGPPVQLLFTKVDETGTYGCPLTVARRSRLPLSYLGTGQEVPDDIEVTTPGALADLLTGRRAGPRPRQARRAS